MHCHELPGIVGYDAGIQVRQVDGLNPMRHHSSNLLHSLAVNLLHSPAEELGARQTRLDITYI